MPLLAPHATIYPLTINPGLLDIPQMALMGSAINVQGTVCGRRHSFISMFSFAAQHGIKPWIEKFPFTKEGITEAFERIENGTLRYRAVLEL